MADTNHLSSGEIAEKIEQLRRERAERAANIPVAEERLKAALVAVEIASNPTDETESRDEAAAAELRDARDKLAYWKNIVAEDDLAIAGLRETLRERQAAEATAAQSAAMAEVRELSRERAIAYDDLQAGLENVNRLYGKMLETERALAGALKRAGRNTSHLDGRRAGIGIQSLALSVFDDRLANALEIPRTHRRLDPVRTWRNLFTFHETSPEGDNAEAA